MYNEILVPTDGSAKAEAAIEEAASMAASCDARLHGVFVTDSGPLEHVDGAYPQAMTEIRALGNEAVERVAAVGAAHGVETDTAVVAGTVHHAIADYVTDADIDVVVMATHSREGVRRHFLGSVTERVIRTVRVPVLAVSDPEDG